MSSRLRTAGTHHNLSWHKRTCAAIRKLRQRLGVKKPATRLPSAN